MPYAKHFIQKLECDYTHISLVEYECAQQNIAIVAKLFGEKGAIFTIEGTAENLERLFVLLGRTVQKH
ncbi:MAG: DUF1949 domain-containing protein [Sulfuricurvum sp.]|nr:DUF1949 domain-containing protein [Sulfuricurvum sp.]